MQKATLLLVPLLLTLALRALPQEAPLLAAPPNVTGYRKWVRVNAKPHRMNPVMAALCVRAPDKDAALKSPHRQHWVTIYVTPNAKQAMLTGKTPFPRGSIVVKEKARTPGGRPELLTVMVKREAGYNPASGDWEYQVYEGPGKRLTEQGRLASCQSCHARWRTGDYISRVYLRGTVWYEGENWQVGRRPTKGK